MPIEVVRLKDLAEEECFSTRRGSFEKIALFLKENKKNVFTSTEIVDELNNNLKPTEHPFQKSSVYNLLTSARNRRSTNIHRKGSYYWYEEKK